MQIILDTIWTYPIHVIFAHVLVILLLASLLSRESLFAKLQSVATKKRIPMRTMFRPKSDAKGDKPIRELVMKEIDQFLNDDLSPQIYHRSLHRRLFSAKTGPKS